VAVVGGDHKVALRPVKSASVWITMWVIESGVQAGEMVVTEGLQKVRDGSTVRIKQSTPATKGN